METELDNLENSQPIHIGKKNEKAYMEEKAEGVAAQTFDKEISMDMKDIFNQPPCSRCQEQE